MLYSVTPCLSGSGAKMYIMDKSDSNGVRGMMAKGVDLKSNHVKAF